MLRRLALPCLVLIACLTAPCAAEPEGRALASWKDGPSRTAILDFVEAVTKEGGPDYVAPDERIAVFDNDGTLWSEQPMYVQLAFIIDRVKALAPDHPEWKDTEPYKSILSGDLKGALSGGHKAIVDLVGATHAGMTTAEFDKIARDWIATARHPKTNRPYTEMVFQPMLELLAYLRANGFQTWIVSGGGVEFMRPWAEATYGIPPQQVVGSRIKLAFDDKGEHPVLNRLPEVAHIDDGPGKPVGIQQAIGRRPIAAFGNSDGDFQMLEWVTTGPGRTFGAFVHHDDAEREVAYDRTSPIGKLSRGLDEAGARGWNVISMKNCWGTIFPPR